MHVLLSERVSQPSPHQAPNQHRGVLTLALSHPPSKPTSFDGDRDVADWAWPISISCAGEQIHPRRDQAGRHWLGTAKQIQDTPNN